MSNAAVWPESEVLDVWHTATAPLAAPAGDTPFGDWLPIVTPGWRWDWPHIRLVIQALEQLACGALHKLMIFLPPQHGKTELASVRFPVYWLERDPTARIILGAYNQTYANKLSRKARRIALSRVPAITFADDRAAVEEWETLAGGGLKAVGRGAGITGNPGDLIVLDDPIKGREEADSELIREAVWEWYTDELYTRRQPGTRWLLMVTRWHELDLPGRILASDDGPSWTVVRLPALADEPNDPLGRPMGAALCPDRFDRAALLAAQRLSPWSFDALYQQRPTPRQGELFDPGWFPIVDAAPAIAVRVRGWDQAATTGSGDYTAGARVSRTPDGLYYVEHVTRGQWAPGARDRLIRQTAELDGPTVAQEGEQEPGAAGKTAALAFVAMLAGFIVRTTPASGDKATRAGPFASQAQVGNVRLVRGDWNQDFLEELRQFPRGKHDDQVDAVALAFNRLTAPVGAPPSHSPLRGSRAAVAV